MSTMRLMSSGCTCQKPSMGVWNSRFSDAQSMTHRRLIVSGTLIRLEHHPRFETVACHEEIAGHSNIG